MDFIVSSNTDRLGAMRQAMLEVGYAKTNLCLDVFDPRFGCIVASYSKYFNMNPYISSNSIFLVIGDPLINSGHRDLNAEQNKRTIEVSERWDRIIKGHLTPKHPSAMIRVSRDIGNIEIVTDAWGAVSVYYYCTDQEIIVASSPDLIARVDKKKFDCLSAFEKLCSGQISFPNTLFKDIKELSPASIIEIVDGSVKTTAWWRPPLPDLSVPAEEWPARIHEAAVATFRDIAQQVSPSGSVTLSGGLDSRFLAALATETGLLDLEAVSLATTHNLESWTARKVASRLRLPISVKYFPVDHYASIYLNKHIEFGTNVNWIDAHFAENAFGDLARGAFILGGYMADTVLNLGDPFHGERGAAIRTRVLPQSSPRWSTNTLFEAFSAEETESITHRWDAADASFSIGPEHSQNLRNVFPSSRQGHKAHFEAGRRNYPIYEIFMTSEMLNIGFSMPDEVKSKSKGKYLFFARYIEKLSDISVNPAKSKKVQSAIASYKLAFPKELWPEDVKHPGGWAALRCEKADLLKAELANARETVSDRLELDLSKHLDRRTSTRIYEIGVAMENAALN